MDALSEWLHGLGLERYVDEETWAARVTRY